MKNLSLLMTIAIIVIAMSSFAQETDTFTDSRDGKIYKIVKIGTQIWMAENLAYRVRSGCWVYDNKQNNVTTYGYLYNWETAKKVCPSGWHLPSKAEWTTQIDYLGGLSIAETKMKSTSGWEENCNGTNESGFAGFPGGCRDDNKAFDEIGQIGYWWSSTELKISEVPSDWRGVIGDQNAWYRSLHSVGLSLWGNIDRHSGFSVRCLRD